MIVSANPYCAPMHWFGDAWPTPDLPAPICDPSRHKPTPAGQPCSWCEEPIADGENGVLMPHMGLTDSGAHYATVRPLHKECFIRSTAGGLAHLDKQCTCFGGGSSHDSGLTERQEAVAVYQRLISGAN